MLFVLFFRQRTAFNVKNAIKINKLSNNSIKNIFLKIIHNYIL
jgi:hypothetical protein